MKPIEALVLMFCAVVALVLLGRRLGIPYPIALVLGGLGISLVPHLPTVRIDPDLLFLLVLPPLLYAAAWFTSWHEFKENLRPILLLAVGLVLFTMVVVGVVVRALIPGIPLSVAMALGALVSPPDAVATAAIAQQMRLPKRIVTILEGESLVNDATGLVALRFALVAAASGTFVPSRAVVEFVGVVVGGLALGLAVGLLLERLLRRIQDKPVVITISLLVPYLAFLPAERLHVSGVLACVAAGLYGGWKGGDLLSASTRLTAVAFWNMFVFLLNCAVFILIGLQLPEVRKELGDHNAGELVIYGVAVSAVVIGVRPLWVFPAAWLPRWLSPRLRRRDPMPSWKHLVIVSWAGMRGVVSLAAALALPRSFPDGRPLPERDLVVFLTFCVLLATLVLQGLTLPYLIRALRVQAQPDESLERRARVRIAEAALAHLGQSAQEKKLNTTALQVVTGHYQERLRHLNDPIADALGWSNDREHLVGMRGLWREGLRAERRELLRLRREHAIDDELMRRIERELDLEETRLQA